MAGTVPDCADWRVTATERNFLAFLRQLAQLPSTRFGRDAGVEWFFADLPSPVFNHVYHTELEPDTADAAIRRVLERIRAADSEASWWVCPQSRPADLDRRLQRQGVLHAQDWAGMAIDLDQLNAGAARVKGLRVTRVFDAPGLRRWMEAFSRSFRHEPEVAQLLLDIWSDPLCSGELPFRFYVGELNGAPVSCSLLFPAEGVAGLYCVGTIPAARRRGYGAALTVAPLLDARREGFRTGVLQATEMGLGVYRRLGFREICRFGLYLCPGWLPAEEAFAE